MPITTTLTFSGRTEEALKFYSEALEVETLFLMRCSESPIAAYHGPEMAHLVFHATFRIEGTEFMASDVGYAQGHDIVPFSGFALAVTQRSSEQARLSFEKLSRGGQVLVPFAKSAFTGWYGVVVDRFGLSWKFNVAEGRDGASGSSPS